MNIYLKVEIRRRELEARLLLGLVAAERGHDVLVGDFSALLSHRQWLRPGVFHDKTLAPKASRLTLNAALADAGFLLSSQDEEHGLGDRDYRAFALRRFDPRTLATATTVCCWGDHDRTTLRELYPDAAERFVLTGSPRVDLWRPALARRLPSMRAPSDDPDRPYVLVAPGSRPFIPHPFWVAMADLRPRQFRGLDDDREWDHYRKFSEAYRYVGRLVRAIRLAATELPEVLFVVRPHPKSPDGAWEGVLGDLPNAVVDRSGDAAGAWLRDAVALVHNGSTTGAEAAMMGVPVISFQPHGERADRFTNRVGQVASSEEDLIATVGRLLQQRPAPEDAAGDAASHAVLAERLSIDPRRLSADRIVDAWEEHDRPGLAAPNTVRRADRTATAHRAVGALRTRTRRVLGPEGRRRTPGFDETPKFPPVTDRDVAELAAGLRDALDRFHDVEVERISGRLVRIRRG